MKTRGACSMAAIEPRASRIAALAEKSSYVENVLTHALVAGLAGELWQLDPSRSLQVFNSEVDDSGFDVILGVGAELRYIQLKQAHDEKVPAHVSVRLQFSELPGSCVVLMSHRLADLALTGFRFYGGAATSEPMPGIAAFSTSKAPGRRTADGARKVRENYRNVLVSRFSAPLDLRGLLLALFPGLGEVAGAA